MCLKFRSIQQQKNGIKKIKKLYRKIFRNNN